MQVKILVVDDEPDLEQLIRQKFRKKIRDHEYAFSFAANGVEALKVLRDVENIDLVLTDINMPEMDGLTLLSKMNELQNPLLRSVIVSAYGDMENIRTAMNRGAFDFVIKPIDLGDLEITMRRALDDLVKLKDAMQSRDQLVTLQHELDIARTIQMSILPKTFPAFPDRKEFDIHAEMIPAREVGGDFYDFFLIDADHLGFSIGDVSGKGVPAALFMAISRTILKTTALKGLPPEECLSQVNAILHKESVSSMFVTVFYGILDIRSGDVVYCNGGHLPPYKIGRNGKADAIQTTGNPALCMLDDAPYNAMTIRLQPGEGLFLYTDGITEAMTPDHVEYGEERLLQSLQKPQKSAKAVIQGVLDSVKKHSDGQMQSDDITALAFWYR